MAPRVSARRLLAAMLPRRQPPATGDASASSSHSNSTASIIQQTFDNSPTTGLFLAQAGCSHLPAAGHSGRLSPPASCDCPLCAGATAAAAAATGVTPVTLGPLPVLDLDTAHDDEDRPGGQVEGRRLSRLVRVCSPWRSSSEMSLNSAETRPPAGSTGAHQAHYQQRAPSTATRSTPGLYESFTSLAMHSSPFMFAPGGASSHLSFPVMFSSAQPLITATAGTTSVSMPAQQDATPTVVDDHPTSSTLTHGRKRLWHSLVIPLVLGGAILLITIRARQMNFSLANDTMAMIVVMAAVFTVMSGVVFWLATDQQDFEHNQQQNHDDHHSTYLHHNYSPQHYGAPRLSSTSSTSSLHQHSPNCHHHHQQRYLNNNNNSDEQEHNTCCCDKCRCGISVVDFQPPDYYSAVRDSLPVYLRRATSSSDTKTGHPADRSLNCPESVIDIKPFKKETPAESSHLSACHRADSSHLRPGFGTDSSKVTHLNYSAHNGPYSDTLSELDCSTLDDALPSYHELQFDQKMFKPGSSRRPDSNTDEDS